MSHHCHARGCTVSVPPEMLMCRDHWFKVPHDIRAAVWQHYRPGQCDDKSPSKEWHQAADAAIGFVAAKERKQLGHAEIEALRHFNRVDDERRVIRMGWVAP